MAKRSVKKKISNIKNNKNTESDNCFILEQRQEKMSEILVDFAKPLIDSATNEDELRASIRLSVLIWNLSFMSNEEQKKMKEDICKMFEYDQHFSQDLKLKIELLLNRKEESFSNIKRNIVNYEDLIVNGRIHLEVQSCYMI